MNRKRRVSLLSSDADWIFLEIILLYIATLIYTVIIWQEESGQAATTMQIFKAVIKEVVPFTHFAVVVIIGSFEFGGELVLRFTRKIKEAHAQGVEEGHEKGLVEGRAQGVEQGRAQGVEQGRAQGVEQGRDEVYQLLEEWDRRRREAEEKGIPFTESLPGRSNNGNGNRT